MTHETHRHCQCDFCTGEDCGSDNPSKKNAEQKALQDKHDTEIRKEVLGDLLKRIESKPTSKWGESERCHLYTVLEDMGFLIPE
jgi:hypothetical protein